MHMVYMYYTPAAAASLQSCPTLCDPRDSSPAVSSIPGILQARTLEWVAISFSNMYYTTYTYILKSRIRIKSHSCSWPYPKNVRAERSKYLCSKSDA